MRKRKIKDVIPSLGEILKKISASPITRDWTPEVLAKHRVMLAENVRRLLLKHGRDRGWEMARAIYNRPVIGMTALDRDLTEDELIVLKESLGYEFDRKGRLVGKSGTELPDTHQSDGGHNAKEEGESKEVVKRQRKRFRKEGKAAGQVPQAPRRGPSQGVREGGDAEVS